MQDIFECIYMEVDSLNSLYASHEQSVLEHINCRGGSISILEVDHCIPTSLSLA